MKGMCEQTTSWSICWQLAGVLIHQIEKGQIKVQVDGWPAVVGSISMLSTQQQDILYLILASKSCSCHAAVS